MIKRISSLPIGGITEEATIYRRGISPILDSWIPPLSAASLCNPASEKAIRTALDEMQIGSLAFVNEGTGSNIFSNYDATSSVAYFRTLSISGTDMTVSESSAGLSLSAGQSAAAPTYIDMIETGVAGGNCHFSKTFELSSIYPSGVVIGRISNGDMIGRISLKCLSPMQLSGQLYTIGTRSTNVSSLAYDIEPTSTTGLMFDFSYGSMLTGNEFAYFDADDDLIFNNDIRFQGTILSAGKIAVNVLYDHAYWDQDSAYILGDGDTADVMKVELDTETVSDKQSYLSVEASRYGSTSDSARYIYALDGENGQALQRFDSDNDTASLIGRGNALYATTMLHGQCQHSSTDFYAFGGRLTVSAGMFNDTVAIQRFSFANDTADAVYEASLMKAVEAAQSWKTTTKAFIGGGQTWTNGSITSTTSGSSALIYNEHKSIQSYEFSTLTTTNEVAELNGNRSNGATVTDSLLTYIVNGSSYDTLSGFVDSSPAMSTFDHTNSTVTANSNAPIYSAHSQFGAKNTTDGFFFGGSGLHRSISNPMHTVMKMSLSTNTFYVSNKMISRDITNESGDSL